MPIELQTNVSLEVTPSAPKHLVNVEYLEQFFSGKIKGPVRLVSVVDIAGTYAPSPAFTLTATATGELEIDGEPVDPNDRVLLAGQTDQTQNGIYVVTDPGSASTNAVLTRADDFDDSSKIESGVSVTVHEGDHHANTSWRLATQGVITLDATALVFISVTPATGAAKYVEEITGDGTKTVFEIEHNLGTEDVQVQLWNVNTKAIVLTDIEIVDGNEIEVSFGEAPDNTKNYRVVVIG